MPLQGRRPQPRSKKQPLSKIDMKYTRLFGSLFTIGISCFFLFSPAKPVSAQGGYTSGPCQDAARAQFNAKMSDFDFVSCEQDTAVCGTKGGTVVAANGCNNSDICCAKPHGANFVSCKDFADQSLGASNVESATCRTGACNSSELDYGGGHCGVAGKCCVLFSKDSNIPDCQQVTSFNQDQSILTAGCYANAEACTSDGGTVANQLTNCTPGICCKLPSRPAGTCAQAAQFAKGKAVETVCAGEFDCPTGYEKITPRDAGMRSISGCAEPKLCCAKSDGGSKGPKGASPPLQDPLSGASIFDTIRRVITVFLGMVGALTFAVFVYAGVMWMTAGSSDRVNVAKDAIKYAMIGLILIGFSFAITNFIIDALANQGPSASSSIPLPEPTTPQELQP